jgi:hypothetical protein
MGRSGPLLHLKAPYKDSVIFFRWDPWCGSPYEKSVTKPYPTLGCGSHYRIPVMLPRLPRAGLGLGVITDSL